MKQLRCHTFKLLCYTLSVGLTVSVSNADIAFRHARCDSSAFYSADSSCHLSLSWNDTSHGSERLLGKLYRHVPGITDELLWQAPLINSNSSDAVLVSNDGVHIVTFQTRQSGGFGDNVVALYGDQGRPIRKYGLQEICPYRADVSSPSRMWVWDAWDENYWGSGHWIDEVHHHFVLRMIPNCERFRLPEDVHMEVRIDLLTGNVLTPLNHPQPPPGAPDTLWTRRYDFGLTDVHCRGAARAVGGGFFYVISGKAGRRYEDPTRALLLRIGIDGDTLWVGTLAACGRYMALAGTSDGGVVCATVYKNSPSEPTSEATNIFHIEKRNTLGEVVWRRDEEASEIADTRCAVATHDNSVVFASGIRLPEQEGLQLRKLDRAGRDVWTRRYSSAENRSISGITEMVNGDLLLVNGGAFSAYRTSATGDSLWRIPTVSGGLRGVAANRAGGALFSRGNVIQQINEVNALSERIVVSERAETTLDDLQQCVDGGWLMAGTTRAALSHGSDFLVVRCDRELLTLWSVVLGSPWNDFSPVVQETADGGYLLCGLAGSSIWIFKIGAQ